MTPVERLEAAIAKLEAQRDASMAGRWESYLGDVLDTFPAEVRAYFDNKHNGNTVVVYCRHGRADAELIVTLHRTIDAQLAILRAARSRIARYGAVMDHMKFHALDLDLADAINGSAS